MPDLVGDLLCILEHAGAPEAIVVGYAQTFIFMRVAEDIRLEGMTGALSWRMRQHASARTSLRLS